MVEMSKIRKRRENRHAPTRIDWTLLQRHYARSPANLYDSKLFIHGLQVGIIDAARCASASPRHALHRHHLGADLAMQSLEFGGEVVVGAHAGLPTNGLRPFKAQSITWSRSSSACLPSSAMRPHCWANS